MPSFAQAAKPGRHAELLSRALAYIDAHIDSPLEAATLADRASMSRHHFHRVFHAWLGCSVGTYVTRRRLQRASALLVSGDEPVLGIALAVGYESAQSLNKAMRREYGTTPTRLRRGDTADRSAPLPSVRHLRFTAVPGALPMQPNRFAQLPEGLVALTATGRGMVDHTLERAAQRAFGELVPTLHQAGVFGAASSWLSLMPDDPKGPDDPLCRYVAGVIFGYTMADGRGHVHRPDVPLSGTLAWQPVGSGRYAVFLHVGSYSTLHTAWDAIYRQWLPTSARTLRDVPPMELMLNDPKTTPPAALMTEIWLPVDPA